jgi:hypothetical protein
VAGMLSRLFSLFNDLVLKPPHSVACSRHLRIGRRLGGTKGGLNRGLI